MMLLVRRVAGNSMTPTLVPGRIIVGIRFGRPARPGDVVLLFHSGLEKIKRVADVNSSQIFVCGDNPSESTDSRDFGWISRQTIIGRVVWPLV